MSIRQLVKDRYISLVDSAAPLRGEISDSGFYHALKLPTVAVDTFDGLVDEVMKSNQASTGLASKGFAQPLVITDILVREPALIHCLTDDVITQIFQYLGSKAKLDFVALMVFRTDVEGPCMNDSCLFHHDSVGHRLKYFVPMNSAAADRLETYYVRGSHKIKWPTYHCKDLRANNGFDNILSSKQNQLEPLNPDFGSGVLFDTNGLHKGAYKPTSKPRVLLQYEFSALKPTRLGAVGAQSFFVDARARRFLWEKEICSYRDFKGIGGEIYERRGKSDRESHIQLWMT